MEENAKSIGRSDNDKTSEKDIHVTEKKRSLRNVGQILEDFSWSERQEDTAFARDNNLENGDGARPRVKGQKPITELEFVGTDNQQIKQENKRSPSNYKLFALKKRAAPEKAKTEMLSGVHKGVRTAARANSTVEVHIRL